MKVEFFKQKFCESRRFYVSFFILAMIFCCLGLPFYKWGLFADDFGIIYHAMDVGLNRIAYFFYEGETFGVLLSPINDYVNTLHNFLGGLYRPMVFVYSLLQVHVFGLNPSAFFLVSIFLHSLNSIMLFNIICSFEKIFTAMILTLFFAFHSSLFNWLGWFAAQQYIIELTCLIFILLILRRYILSNKWYYYFLSMCLYILNVFQREMMVVFPFWVLFFCIFYDFENNKISSNIIRGLKLSWGYFFVLFTYVISRGLVFSFNINDSTPSVSVGFKLNFKSFILKMSERFYDFVTILSDYFGLRFLPQNHQFIKGGLILLFTGFLIFMFIRNRKKGLVALVFFSGIMFSWVPIVFTHQPRYIYVGLFFFMICFALLYRFANVFKNFRNCFLVLFSVYIGINYVFLAHGMEYCRIRSVFCTEKLKKLSENIKCIFEQSGSPKPIYYYGLPGDFTFATNQAIRLYSSSCNMQIYKIDEEAKEKPGSIIVTWDYLKNDFRTNVTN